MSSSYGPLLTGLMLVSAGLFTSGCNSSSSSGSSLFNPAVTTSDLSFSKPELHRSLSCSPDIALSGQPPVLLVHATTVNSDTNFGWNYIPAFQAQGIPYCTVELPEQGMEDIQASAEFVVYAIRAAHQLSGRRIRVVGHSQGGMVPRWALRYWPDTRAMVEDLVAMGSPNHGSAIVETMCLQDCAPAIWQQRASASFIRALNCDTETFPEIDYTNIYTHTDEFVQPNLDDSGSTSLTPGTNVANIALQDICPTDTTDHLAIGSYSAVAYALVMDAISHDGPADQKRIAVTSCLQPWMPGVAPESFAINYTNAVSTVVSQLMFYPHSAAEPPSKDYVPVHCR